MKTNIIPVSPLRRLTPEEPNTPKPQKAPEPKKRRPARRVVMPTFYFLLVLFSVSLTSCEFIGDVFQAGVGVGVFLVILVIAIIIWAIVKMSKR